MKENSHFSDFLQVKNIIHFILYVSRFAFKFKVSQYSKFRITKDEAAHIYNVGILFLNIVIMVHHILLYGNLRCKKVQYGCAHLYLQQM